jgi:hypothetical protein
MKKIIFLILLIPFLSYADVNPLDRMVSLDLDEDGNIPLMFVFSEISRASKMPIFIESNIDPRTDLVFKYNEGNAAKILDEICSRFKGHSFKAKDGVIYLVDEELISDKDSPLGRQFPQAEKNSPRGGNGLEKFINGLEKERLFLTQGIECDVKKEYKDTTIKNALIDIIRDNGFCCWVHRTTDEDTKKYIEVVKDMCAEYKKRDMKLEDRRVDFLNKTGPIYRLYIFGGYDKSAETKKTIENKIPPKETVSPVLDGRKMLKMESIFNPKDNSMSISIENITMEDLFFKDVKNCLMVQETYPATAKSPWGRGGRGGAEQRLVYPPDKNEFPATFSLKPKQKMTLRFNFIGARTRRGYIWDMDAEQNHVKYGIYPEQMPFEKVGKVLTDDFDLLPVIYFYDKADKKYKSRGCEANMKGE